MRADTGRVFLTERSLHQGREWMKELKVLAALSFILTLSTSCRTTSDKPADGAATEVPEYDGSADSTETLPDCSPEMVGSQFWVRQAKTAYECAQEGKWEARGHEDPDDPKNFGPRSIKD